MLDDYEWMKFSLWLLHYHSCEHSHTLQLVSELLRRCIKRKIMSSVQMVQCVCVCVYKLLHTHKQQAWQGSLLTAWPSPFHACICMVYNVVLHLFWSYIISNTFQCVWTPTPILLHIVNMFFSTHIYMYFSFNKVNLAVLVAAVPRFG